MLLHCSDHQGNAFRAWRLPPIGSSAEDAVPDWMVDLMLDGIIEVNGLGGLTSRQAGCFTSCLPGDIILFDQEEKVEFCPERTFDTQYIVH